MDDSLPELGDLEREVMQLVWANAPITAEAVREQLSRPLKESTVRTVLRRLEDKGYTTHTVDGRTYVYHAAEPRGRVAAKAVQRIVDWFCNGSVEEVLVGMVDSAMLDQRQLRMLADQVAKAKERGRQRRRETKNDAGHSGRVGAALSPARRRRVDRPESSSGAKSARSHDMLAHGAGGVAVDAASDALGHGEHHAPGFAGPAAATVLAGREPAAGGRAAAAAVGSGMCRSQPMPAITTPSIGWRWRRPSTQSSPACCCCDWRSASPDVAPGARRKAVACALDRQLARARERCRSAGRSRSDRPFCCLRNASIGTLASARPCWPTRAPTSPTAISMCCFWPRSIARCSGSVRSHGGSLPGWPSLPNSSATQARWKSSKTGCPMPRSCSISCSAFGARRRACKWQGRARCARGWSTFSPPPRPRQG